MPSRSYLDRYTVILITSRDSVAILLLYRCLRHFHTEHELRAIFHHFNFLKSDRKSQIALFENFLTNKNFSFLLISCTRNRHSTVIESYIRRDDVIRYELDLVLINNWFIIKRWSRSLSRNDLINFHKSLSRDVLLKE
jgi:hypothetical protein